MTPRRRRGDRPEQAAQRAAEGARREAERIAGAAGASLDRLGRIRLPELLTRASFPKGRPGRLTRSNTVPGSVERSAVDRIAYERRQAERRPGETARAGAGHAAPGTGQDVVPVFIAGPARLLLSAEVDHRTAARVGRYLEATRRLLDGRLADDEFRRRFRNWRPIVVLGPPELAGEYRLLTDPSTVLALAEAARSSGEEIIFDSGRRRPVQRRTPQRPRRPKGRQ